MATLQRYPADQNFIEIALSSTVFAKNSKILNDRHFWRDKILLKIGMATPQR